MQLTTYLPITEWVKNQQKVDIIFRRWLEHIIRTYQVPAFAEHCAIETNRRAKSVFRTTDGKP